MSLPCQSNNTSTRRTRDVYHVAAAEAPSQPQAHAMKAEDAAGDAAQDDDELDIQLDEDVRLSRLWHSCSRCMQSSGHLANITH